MSVATDRLARVKRIEAGLRIRLECAEHEVALAREAVEREATRDEPVTGMVLFAVRPSDAATIVGMVSRYEASRDSMTPYQQREMDLLRRTLEALS